MKQVLLQLALKLALALLPELEQWLAGLLESSPPTHPEVQKALAFLKK